MSDNIVTLVKETERYAKPTSIEELQLKPAIKGFFLEIQNIYHGNIDKLIIEHYENPEKSKEFIEMTKNSENGYIDVLANIFYEKKAHNGLRTIWNDKERLVGVFDNDLKNTGVSEKQIQTLMQVHPRGFKDGQISKEDVWYLWGFFPDRNHSNAAFYELTLKELIKQTMTEILTENYLQIQQYIRQNKGKRLQNLPK